ncbi:hypothetical protein H310_05250 [Aphanomyces invadans]|uniref:BZIP domain-containing protein n=1 Tax=Aphanomyces invadans TaxID=157072 RepID=A0A024U8J2_9STRA|nr:hypothetical protein H310_05250 [Aphanomyces invadans]ETW02751.1 hypothetical protein H310_05250 [Aphanomyces invadans]|eukprot:XP_008868135.1 hypothetical protein H310_05250 [Aphanomyces invadans]
MEDWMPDDHDIDILVDIDNAITSKGEATKQPDAEGRTISPQCGPPQEDFASDEDSSDGEDNLELALEQSQNDSDVVKRLRHRLISRRSRHKKKRELVDLAETVYALERQYHALQSSFPSLHTADTSTLAKQSQYRNLLQLADQLRVENNTLQRAIDKLSAFASSVQASTAAADTWTLDNIHSMTVCDFAAFRPLSVDQCHDKLARMLREMSAFDVPSTATTYNNFIDGWTDRRDVAATRLVMKSSKSIPASSVDGLLDRTWHMLTHASRLQHVLPFLRKLDVLQALPPSPLYNHAVIVRRDFQFRRQPRQLRRVHYTTLLVVWHKSTESRHRLTSQTIDQPVTEQALGDGETWMNECLQLEIQPVVGADASVAHISVQGWQIHARPCDAQAALVSTLQALLTWDRAVLPPC